MGFLLVDVNGLEPLTLRTSSVICTPLQLLKQRIYAGKEQYRIAKNKTVAHKLHTKNDLKASFYVKTPFEIFVFFCF